MVRQARNTMVSKKTKKKPQKFKNSKKPQESNKPKKKIETFPLLRGRTQSCRGEGISVVIPVGGKDRIPQLRQVLRNLHAQNYEPLQILISEYGTSGEKWFRKGYGPQVHYLYTKGGELFNKSKAMNKGFVAARHEICVLVDADIILPTGYLASIDKHIQDHEACFLLKRVLHTPVGPHLKHNIIPPINYIRDDNFNGASLGIRQSAYYKIGGMCEQFEGYGYEDLEFWDRLHRLLKLNKNRIHDVIHLNHGHMTGYDRQWGKNQKIWNKLAGQSPESRAAEFRKILMKYSTQ